MANEGRGLPRQDEEGGLEGILGGMSVAQHASADAKYQRPMPAHKNFNGGLVPASQEPLQKLAIRHRRRRYAADQVANVVQYRICLCLGHARALAASKGLLPY
jgi:hypothetical protein